MAFNLQLATLLFLIGFCKLSAQNDDISKMIAPYIEAKNYKMALSEIKKVLVKETDDERKYLLQIKQLELLTLQQDYDKAENLSAALTAQIDPQNSYYKSLLAQQRSLYEAMGKNKEMFDIQEKLLQYLEKTLGKNHTDYIAELLRSADMNADIQQYKKSELVLESALEIIRDSKRESSVDYINALNKLAAIYSALHFDEKAKGMYMDMLKKIESIEDAPPRLHSDILCNLAIAHTKLRENLEAEKLYKSALSKCKQIDGEDCSEFENALAIFYIGVGKYELAEKIFLALKQRYTDRYGAKHPDIALVYINLADVYGRAERFEEAYEAIGLSLFSNSNMNTPPLINDQLLEQLLKHQFMNPFFVATSLSMLDKVYLYEYISTKSVDVLQKKHKNMQRYRSYIERLTPYFHSEEDKLWVVQISNDEFSSGIWTAWELNKRTKDKSVLKDAFYYFESNKAALLNYTIKSNDALQFGEVPDSLLALEKSLQADLNNLKKQGAEAPMIKGKILEKEETLKNLVHQLEKDYPQYFQFKYQNNQISATKMQELLPDNNTAVLSYYVWRNAVLSMGITKNKVVLVPLRLHPSELSKQIDSLRFSLTDYRGMKEDPTANFNQFVKHSDFLYQKILSPLLDSLSDGKDSIHQLIIIPDNILGNIPFEVLLTDSVTTSPGDFAALPYLLHQYKISYTYSGTLLSENTKRKKAPTKKGILGYAASYSQEMTTNRSVERGLRQSLLRKALQDLPAAKEEVQSLEKNYAGQFLYGADANEKHFIEQSGQYQIIHLAMHGLLNEKNPLLSALAFTENADSDYDNFVEAHEISRLKLHAELVVLSACETGYGKFEQGEGVMSLARSFMYAGVSSLVVSLWQVNDGSTAMIMKSFYRNLAVGMDKAEALQQAKLEYIKNVGGGGDGRYGRPSVSTITTTIAAHPAFWAPFIQLGDSRPIRVQARSIASVYLWWWIGGGLAAIAAIGGGAMALRKKIF